MDLEAPDIPDLRGWDKRERPRRVLKNSFQQFRRRTDPSPVLQTSGNHWYVEDFDELRAKLEECVSVLLES